MTYLPEPDPPSGGLHLRPAPLVPPEVNLKRLPWLPIPIDYFATHALALQADPEPFRVTILLVAQAWKLVPAMALPNDNARLAAMGGFGRDIAAWVKVRESVLRDWVLCSDDKFHHPEYSQWGLHSWDRIKEQERFSEQQRQRALAGVRSRGAARAQPIEEERETEIGDEDKSTDETQEKRRVDTEDGRLAPPTLQGGDALTISEAGNQEVRGQLVGEDKAVEIVFEHWKRATGRLKEKLTRDRKRTVQARLREGLSPEILCRAIDAASSDDFYQGRLSKQPRRIDTLDVILKDHDRVLRLASAGDMTQGPVLNQAAAATARTFMKMFGGPAPAAIDAAAVDIPQVPAE